MQFVVIAEKCANFDDATEAAILTLNFNLTSADHAFNRPKKTKNRLNDLCFVVCVNLVRVIYRCQVIWPVTGQGFQNTKWPAVRYFQ